MARGANFLDDVSTDLATWIDETAEKVALGFAPARAPFSAKITEDQKLAFYKTRLFNPDGSPNLQGRDQEMQRLGAEGFGHVYQQVVRRWPELKPPEPEPIAVPEQWPQPAPMMPPGMPPAPGPPLPMGPPMPLGGP